MKHVQTCDAKPSGVGEVCVALNIMIYKIQNADYKILKPMYKLKIQDSNAKYKAKN